MFIPQWVLVVLIVAVVLVAAAIVGEPKGDYDFLSPMIGFAIVLALVAFLIRLGF
jgi:hypothetical protein